MHKNGRVNIMGKNFSYSKQSFLMALLGLLISLSSASSFAAPVTGILEVGLNGQAVVNGNGDYIGFDFGESPIFLPLGVAADGILDSDVSQAIPSFIGLITSSLPASDPFAEAYVRDFSGFGVFNDPSNTLLTYGAYTVEFTSLDVVVPTAGSSTGSVDFGGFGLIKAAGFNDTLIAWDIDANGGSAFLTINTSGALPPELVVTTAVPIPSAIVLMFSGLMGLSMFKRRK